MDPQYTGWSMVPNVPSHSNPTTPSNQDHLFLHQQQFQQHQQQNLYQHQQLQQQQQQRVAQSQQQQQQQQQQQSLASHFHLLNLVEKLAESIETGTRDQQSDALVNELNIHFEKCQQLLNSIAGSIDTKAVAIEGQKRKLEESKRLLSQRRDVISKFKNSVEELIKSEP